MINGDVTDIDLALLKRDGVRGLIFDLDSTLMEPRAGKLSPEVTVWLKNARDNFQVAIVSNNKKAQYIEQVRELLQMPLIYKAAKPRRWAFFEVLKGFNMEASQVAVIGDRPLTDVLGGHWAGMKTVLVWPLKTQREPNWIKMMRKIERFVIKS